MLDSYLRMNNSGLRMFMLLLRCIKCNDLYNTKGSAQMKITSENFIKRFKKGKNDAFEYMIDQYIELKNVYSIRKSRHPVSRMTTSGFTNYLTGSAWLTPHFHGYLFSKFAASIV